MARSIALSTSDNPYNPITDYDNWERFDMEHKYYTNDYLDRVCHTTRNFGDELYLQDIEHVIDEAVKFNLISCQAEGVSYVKVVHES